ncbi:unnamed protein product [Alopecurus aequalis]
MANKQMLALAGLLVLVLAFAATPRPAHAVCNISQDDFMACQSAATATSGHTPGPSNACCMSMRKADLKCLCSYKNSPWLSLYSIDAERAMELPGKCGLTKPSDC